VCILCFLQQCYMLHPAHPAWFDHPNSWCRAQIIMLCTVQYYQSPVISILLGPLSNILKSICVLTSKWETKSCTKTRADKIIPEVCALLGLYTVQSGNSVPTFWEYLSIPSSRVMRLKQNYHCMLRKIPKECRSLLHHGGSLKSCKIMPYVFRYKICGHQQN